MIKGIKFKPSLKKRLNSVRRKKSQNFVRDHILDDFMRNLLELD